MHNRPRFDRWQFDGVRKYHSFQRVGFNFNDLNIGTPSSGNIHVTRRTKEIITRRKDRSWAHNDTKVREVLAAVLSRRAGVWINPTLEDFLFADKILAYKFKRYKSTSELRRHQLSTQRAGGVSAWYLGIIYRSLRLGMDSCVVAQEMDMMPVNVRETLARMNHLADELAKGTFRWKANLRYVEKSQRPKFLQKIQPRRPGESRYDLQEFVRLHNEGKSVREITNLTGASAAFIRWKLKTFVPRPEAAHPVLPAD